MDEILPVQGAARIAETQPRHKRGGARCDTPARHRRKDAGPKAEHRRKAGVLF
ncbi:hypothetical protein H2136_13000 [Aeromonas hydrophila]|uniref:Uncharacterized protein n=1 Tax=Aeromonas hydrophila TaxID=644 RepID=A0A926FM23_AERHY|nr:hypothetical protein [Aeromonas hydrophila]